jgi:hypothetical protein
MWITRFMKIHDGGITEFSRFMSKDIQQFFPALFQNLEGFIRGDIVSCYFLAMRAIAIDPEIIAAIKRTSKYKFKQG